MAYNSSTLFFGLYRINCLCKVSNQVIAHYMIHQVANYLAIQTACLYFVDHLENHMSVKYQGHRFLEITVLLPLLQPGPAELL